MRVNGHQDTRPDQHTNGHTNGTHDHNRKESNHKQHEKPACIGKFAENEKKVLLIDCDLRNIKIKNDIVINSTAIFGGIDIIVPDDIKVVIKSTSIFGGSENKKVNKKEDSKYTIYVNCNCIFGGVEIK